MGWCLAVDLVALGPTRAIPFGWQEFLGVGWIVSLLVGIVFASRRVGGSWTSSIPNTTRNNKVRGYFIEPWKLARSWAVLRCPDAIG